MTRISGLLFDGKQPSKQPAHLDVDDQGITILSALPSRKFPFSKLVISTRIADSTRFLTLPNGWLFETSQNDDLDALIRRFGARDPLSAKREPWLTRLAVLGIALAIAWGTVHFGVPGLARKVAFAVPTDTLVKMGKSSLQQMDKENFQKTKITAARQKAIQKEFSAMVPENKNGFEYKLHFRNAPEIGANAFALPSGDIVVTDDLVILADSDKDLRGVILHEIGHVELRHGMQGIAQTSILTLVVIAISGDINSAGTLMAAIPALLLNAGYSRNMEWDADGYALEKIRQLHYDPALFANMLDKITKSAGVTQSKYWSTHPHSNKRIERIRSEKTNTDSSSI